MLLGSGNKTAAPLLKSSRSPSAAESSVQRDARGESPLPPWEEGAAHAARSGNKQRKVCAEQAGL